MQLLNPAHQGPIQLQRAAEAGQVGHAQLALAAEAEGPVGGNTGRELASQGQARQPLQAGRSTEAAATAAIGVELQAALGGTQTQPDVPQLKAQAEILALQ